MFNRLCLGELFTLPSEQHALGVTFIDDDDSIIKTNSYEDVFHSDQDLPKVKTKGRKRKCK